jgi:UDP-3-O-[3-hydroxymyristoyl] N-acetylglucosamine deacetylase
MSGFTVRHEVLLAGRGLFSGRDVSAIVKPASQANGIVFTRGQSTLRAGIKLTARTANYSCLQNSSMEVRVTEHLFAALWAAGINHAEIELSDLELPNYDGSAIEIYQTIHAVGKEPLGEMHRIGAFPGKTFQGENASEISLRPSSELSVDYRFEHPELGRQHYRATITRENAVREILPARTFITLREVEQAFSAGLIQHRDTSQAIIIENQVPDKPLRFADEYVRHKVLDIIGDLYLLQAELNVAVVARRSGHVLNRQAAEYLHRYRDLV